MGLGGRRAVGVMTTGSELGREEEESRWPSLEDLSSFPCPAPESTFFFDLWHIFLIFLDRSSCGSVCLRL